MTELPLDTKEEAQRWHKEEREQNRNVSKALDREGYARRFADTNRNMSNDSYVDQEYNTRRKTVRRKKPPPEPPQFADQKIQRAQRAAAHRAQKKRAAPKNKSKPKTSRGTMNVTGLDAEMLKEDIGRLEMLKEKAVEEEYYKNAAEIKAELDELKLEEADFKKAAEINPRLHEHTSQSGGAQKPEVDSEEDVPTLHVNKSDRFKEKLYMETCQCARSKQTTILLASGSMGSTWLGQILDADPCSVSFIPKTTKKGKEQLKTHPDGKFRPTSTAQLTEELKWSNAALGSEKSALGIMLSSLSKWPKSTTALKNVKTPTSEPIHILLLEREPFFRALSQYKKNVLRKEQFCANVNQRGSTGCRRIPDSFTIKPEELDHYYREAVKESKSFSATGRNLAKSLRSNPSKLSARTDRSEPSNFLVVNYGELLCSSERIQTNTLPGNLRTFVGLGPGCKPELLGSVTAVKSSPKTIANGIKNMDELRDWARRHSAPWRVLLENITTESDLFC